jgi:hypothetical protein
MINEEEYDEDEETDEDIVDEEEVDYDEEDEEVNEENDLDYEDDMGIVFEKERYQTKLVKYFSKHIHETSDLL